MTTSTPQLPPSFAALVDHPRPDGAVWSALCQFVSGHHPSPSDVAALKRALNSRWPDEVPRPAPKDWLAKAETSSLSSIYRPLLSLCRDVREVDTYPLYIAAAAQSPLLRCRDGSPAVSLWRQPRGVVTLENGAKMKLGEDGMADLGGSMIVEWDRGGCDCPLFARCRCEPHTSHRTEIYVEVEVKLDGEIPVQAPEYRGASKRKPTPTEQDQLTRQKARQQRGGFYGFHERTAEMVAVLVEYRERVQRSLAA